MWRKPCPCQEWSHPTTTCPACRHPWPAALLQSPVWSKGERNGEARACARNHISLSVGCAEASGWLSRKQVGACACVRVRVLRVCSVCEHVCASMCVRRQARARVRVCVPCQRTCGWSLRQLFRSSTSRPLAIPAIENRAQAWPKG